MKNITKILITILSLILLFAIGCGDRPTGSTPSNIPVATGENVTSLTGTYQFTGAGTETTKTDGTTIHVKIDTITGTVTEDGANSMINAYSKDIMIQNNTITALFLADAQLKKTADANTVEAGDGKPKDDGDGGTIIDYIKITFDDINDPQTAEIEYRIKLDSAEGNFEAVAKSVAPYTRVQIPSGGGGGN